MKGRLSHAPSQLSGIVAVHAKIATPETNVPVYLDTMDESTRELKSIRLTTGFFPQTEDEIAIEKSTCYALWINVSVRKAVTLRLVQDDSSTVEQDFVLTGILQDYISKWKRLDSSGTSVSMPLPAVLTGICPAAPLYTHVLCCDAHFPGDLGGKLVENYYSPKQNPQRKERKGF